MKTNNLDGLGDKEITCNHCGEIFIFTVRDQIFFEEHQYVPPKRCRKCRDLRAKEREKFGNKNEHKYEARQ